MSYINVTKIYNSLEELKSLIVIKNAEFIDLDEAAKFLRLKKTYLYNLVYRKEIPYYKPNGKRIYFNKMELNTWIASSKVKSVNEVEEELKQKNDNEWDGLDNYTNK